MGERYNGIYTIMDTGPKVQGRHVDLYMWSCYEALDFGRRPIQLTVLRLGWNPRATGDGMVNRLLNFRRPAASRPASVPATSLPATPAALPDAPPAPAGAVSGPK